MAGLTFLQNRSLTDITSLPSGVPVGKIGQVVQTVKTDTFNTSSTSYTDITGMSLSITPTSISSKILIKTCISWGGSQNLYGYGKFVRNSTDIFMGDSGGGNRVSATFPMEHYDDGSAVYNCFVASSEFLDSPSTTSAITYKVQMASTSGTSYIGRRTDTDARRMSSSITAMEVLA